MTGLGMEARQTTSSWNETDTFPQSHDLFDVDWTLFARVVFCLAAHSESLETEAVILLHAMPCPNQYVEG